MNWWFSLIIISSCIYSSTIIVNFVCRRSKLETRIDRLEHYTETVEKACADEEVLQNAAQMRLQTLHEAIEGLKSELEKMREEYRNARQRAHRLKIAMIRNRFREGARSETYDADESLSPSLKRAMAQINKDVPTQTS